MDWSLVEDLEGRVAAALVAERRYVYGRVGVQQKERRANALREEALKLGAEVMPHLRYARDLAAPRKKVWLPKGYVRRRHVFMYSYRLYAAGKKLAPWLTEIGFDVSRLDRARDLSLEILRAVAAFETSDEYEDFAARILRDKAFMYLQDAVLEIRRRGALAFHGNQKRLLGYRSAYRRRARGSGKGDSDESDGASGEEATEEA